MAADLLPRCPIISSAAQSAFQMPSSVASMTAAKIGPQRQVGQKPGTVWLLDRLHGMRVAGRKRQEQIATPRCSCAADATDSKAGALREALTLKRQQRSIRRDDNDDRSFILWI